MIKICGMTERAAVAAAVASGADAIGFVFAPSVRRVTPEEARTLAAGIPPSVRRVAVMLHPSNEEWQEVLNVFSPDVLQTDAEDFTALEVAPEIECWPVFREGLNETGPPPRGVFLYEGPASGVGQTVDRARAAELARHGQMILAGGLTGENVAAAIAEVRPWGVDVSSAVESQPGKKDPALIQNFIKAARQAYTMQREQQE